MKKFSIYGLATLFAFSFAACDDYEEPNPTPQTNPQESILTTDEVAVSEVAAADPFNLSELDKKSELINIANITVENLPAAYTMGADMQISIDGFTHPYAVPTTVELGEDGIYKVMVNPASLEDVYYTNITKDPAQATVQTRFLATTVTGTDKVSQIAYVGGPTNYYGPFNLTFVPYPADQIIDPKFYLMSNMTNWASDQGVEFSHTAASQYDDPTFKLTFEVTEAQAAQGYEWKVAGASVLGTSSEWLGVSETGDPSDKSGSLVAGGPAGVIYDKGMYIITINVVDLSYTITSAYEQLYVPGTGNGWSFSGPVLLSDDYVTYTGYENLADEFKFTSDADWSAAGNFGAGSEPGTLVNGSNDNCKIPATGNGLYWISVNVDQLTYALTFINNIGIVGTLNGWDAANNLKMTAEEGNLIWKAEVNFDEGGEWKFNMNEAWDLSLGGSITDLIPQSDVNLASPGAGTYEVTLDLTKRPYSCTLVKK
jgi:hypothetical protein